MATANSTGKYLKDSNGNRFSPIASAETIYVEDGVNVKNALNNKQEKLISGTNIKTINNTSLLGSGNITALTNISSYVKNNLTYSTSNTTYALSAYQGYLLNQNKENSSNKVTSITASSTDTQYPSAKCVYDNISTKQNTLVSGTNIKTINNQSLLGSGNITISGGGSSGTVLYNNANGTNGDVVLNASLSNYTTIKIFYWIDSLSDTDTIYVDEFSALGGKIKLNKVSVSSDDISYISCTQSDYIFDANNTISFHRMSRISNRFR